MAIDVRTEIEIARPRAEVAAYSECTEAQMMAMFSWRDHKMLALYIAKASGHKLAISGMEKDRGL